MFEGLRKYLSQAVLIVLRYVSNPDRVKIDLVFLVQWTALHAECQHVFAGFSRRTLQDVRISGRPGEAIQP